MGGFVCLLGGAKIVCVWPNVMILETMCYNVIYSYYYGYLFLLLFLYGFVELYVCFFFFFVRHCNLNSEYLLCDLFIFLVYLK